MTTTSNAAENGNGFQTQNDDMTIPRNPLGLYLHIPFCIQKCNYCDFLSFGGITADLQREYFRSLVREIRYYGKIYGNKYYVDSIFIGGGTPSLVEENLIRDLMDAVRCSFMIDKHAEISIESNPKTLTEKKITTYLETGINRLSIGAQSFDEELLGYMGRVHSYEDFLKNYAIAREYGFRNINIDLMFAIPGQTLQVWMDTLEQAVSLEPEHISFYSLQLEEETPFFSMLQEGRLVQIDDELDRDMYHSATRILKGCGYQQYEISNAAKNGYQCRHNLKYWSMDNYLGIGLGSHSYMEGTRFSNTTDLMEYLPTGKLKVNMELPAIEKIDPELTAGPYVKLRHLNTKDENLSEYLFTGMRKIKGIELSDFQKRFDITLESIYGSVLKKYIENGLIEIGEGYLRFTDKGIDVANTVLMEFV